MKLIHCADLHLDAKMNTYLTKEQAKERKNEILLTFTRMVDYAVENDVKVIMIAGDLFDTTAISATAKNTVWDAITSHPTIDFIYLQGNHDVDSFLTKVNEIPTNLKLFSEEWTSYSYGNIVISGLELSEENLATRYPSLTLMHENYNIVMLHGQLTEYKNKKVWEGISLNELRNKNIDYLALGHVHGFVKDRLDARGIYCYSGCLEGRGFDECGEKGFVLLDIDETDRRAEITFVPIATRTLYTLAVDVSGVNTTQEAARCIKEALEKANYSKDSLVKIDMVGKIAVESEINADFLQDMFADEFYFEKVKDSTQISADYGDYENDASLKGEFIRLILQSNLPKEKQSEVIRCGILALSEEKLV